MDCNHGFPHVGPNLIFFEKEKEEKKKKKGAGKEKGKKKGLN